MLCQDSEQLVNSEDPCSDGVFAKIKVLPQKSVLNKTLILCCVPGLYSITVDAFANATNHKFTARIKYGSNRMAQIDVGCATDLPICAKDTRGAAQITNVQCFHKSSNAVIKFLQNYLEITNMSQ